MKNLIIQLWLTALWFFIDFFLVTPMILSGWMYFWITLGFWIGYNHSDNLVKKFLQK